jgi:peptidyl-prolyl cis-trans isomerase SurA
VVSRFGVHLIQVVARRQVPVEMKQLREMARNMLREQRFESAYADWQRELRAQAYIEFRDAPSP